MFIEHYDNMHILNLNILILASVFIEHYDNMHILNLNILILASVFIEHYDNIIIMIVREDIISNWLSSYTT